MRRLALLLLLVGAAPAGETHILVTSGGKPLEGVGVRMLTVSDKLVFDPDTWAPEARTDADGRVALEGRHVMLYAPGFALAVVRIADPAEPVVLRPERVFGGSVLDSAGEPVPHAEVELLTTVNAQARFLARTDAQGRFFVRALWYDEYELTVRASGYLPSTRDCHPEETGIALTVQRPCALGGTVLHEGGEPLEGVELTAQPGGATARTDSAGRFLIEGVAPGPITVWAPPQFSVAAWLAELQDGERRSDLVLRAVRPAWIRIAVRDAEGVPLGAAQVAGQSVDGEGRATLPIPARTVEGISISCAGYLDAYVSVGPLQPGTGEAEITVALVRPPGVEVTVLTPEGRPVEEGRLGDHDLRDGKVVIHGGGRFEVRVPGYPVTRVGVAPPGPLIVTLNRPSYLSGRIVDGAGTPVARGWVDLEPTFEPCDAEGRFRIGPVPAGARVELSSGASGFRSVRLPCIGGDDDILVRLATAEAEETVRGQVRRGDAPVTRFTVQQMRVANAEGRFELLVARQRSATVQFEVGGHRFHRPLPSPGEEMLVRVAAGGLVVDLGEGGAGVQVSLGTRGDGAVSVAAADGVASFAALDPGNYTLRAAGYESQSVEIREGESRRLRLARLRSGRVIVRLPAGSELEGIDDSVRLPDGRYATNLLPGWKRIHVPPLGILEANVEAGEVTEIDLAPPDLGSLSIRTRPSELVELSARFGRFEILRRGMTDAHGMASFPSLLPGSYRYLRFGWHRGPRVHTLQVAPSVETRIELDLAGGTIAGRIEPPATAPSVAATISLVPADVHDAWEGKTSVDHRGEFRFDEVAPGRYVVRVTPDDESYAPASGTVVVTEDGTFPPQLRLKLEPALRALLQIRGPGGDPLFDANVVVDGIEHRDIRFGRCLLPRLPARVDLDALGFAGVRGLVVDREGELRLSREAKLAVRSHEPVVLLIHGRVWEPLPPARLPVADRRGWVRFEGLPAGPAVVTLREGGPSPAPLHPILLTEGEEAALDLAPR